MEDFQAQVSEQLFSISFEDQLRVLKSHMSQFGYKVLEYLPNVWVWNSTLKPQGEAMESSSLEIL